MVRCFLYLSKRSHMARRTEASQPAVGSSKMTTESPLRKAIVSHACAFLLVQQRSCQRAFPAFRVHEHCAMRLAARMGASWRSAATSTFERKACKIESRAWAELTDWLLLSKLIEEKQ
eukprot:TRINITY_DN11944_c0_g1_i1.p1 TRINITY_DN11944_c0_g1~~TRINITY_DN11944_c0_g1_i1.p1  ORF type:complete len:118 (-),score=10.26 TRINITY_DN11944_c0_g1_i1:268-621(-)